MTRSLTTLLVAAALAACGSSSPAPRTAPVETATVSPPPAAPADPASAAPAVMPARPAQPAEPENAGPAKAAEPENAGPVKAAAPANPGPEKAAAKHAPPARHDPKAELLAAEASAWRTARPVFVTYCASCHTREGKKATRKKLDHFDMDSYPIGGHHATKIGFTVRDVLGITGKKPTMPYDKRGAVKGDELAAIKAWTDAWEAAENGGAHASAAGHHD